MNFERSRQKITAMCRIANEISKLSTCSRLQVGAVFTTEDFRILGVGYNGVPGGVDHCIEANPEGDKDRCYCVHAEQNGIVNSMVREAGTKYLFCTAFPCPMCLKISANFGVKYIYYLDPYRYFDESAALADKLNIQYVQWEL